LRAALRASLRKIIVFLGAVLTIVLIVGTLMYLIEEMKMDLRVFHGESTGRL
jgi:hypothetical protein